jgi:hypothetical protein
VQHSPPDEPLSDEHGVFADCVEDVLASAAGLRYAALRDPEEIGRRSPRVYAQFLIETNPVHDLALSIELTNRAFVIRINGMPFGRVRGPGSRFEWWVERRCRDLERMLGGDLRVAHRTLLNVPVTSKLEVKGGGKKWRTIATHENGLLALLSYLVPYTFVMGGKKQDVYEDWFVTADEA